ncbi:hypothetical protein DFJ74DRAFT_420883 [Hyaloraphidium curvatum]|nr:hypothetical protein DFJ74DRAFT_420883 [Hyaloraphidium curvatum]
MAREMADLREQNRALRAVVEDLRGSTATSWRVANLQQEVDALRSSSPNRVVMNLKLPLPSCSFDQLISSAPFYCGGTFCIKARPLPTNMSLSLELKPTAGVGSAKVVAKFWRFLKDFDGAGRDVTGFAKTLGPAILRAGDEFGFERYVEKGDFDPDTCIFNEGPESFMLIQIVLYVRQVSSEIPPQSALIAGAEWDDHPSFAAAGGTAAVGRSRSARTAAGAACGAAPTGAKASAAAFAAACSGAAWCRSWGD